jgi:DNA-binding CsgD family transcriptional regulator
MRRRQVTFFLSLAEDAAPHLDRAGQAVWLSRLELEHDNLRAALGWLLDHGCVDDARRLGVALWLFWSLRGHLGEGRAWLARILALPGERTPVWARVLFGAGLLAYQQGDPTPMEPLHEQALAFWQQRGDQAEIASNLHRLGDLARMRGDYARARELLEQGLAASRRAEHRGTEAWCLGCLGYVAYFEGDYVVARDQQMEALRLFRQVGSERGVAMMLRNVGMALHHLGDLAAARPFLEDALAKARDMGEKWLVANATQPLGEFALDAGEIASAQALLVESMRLRRELGDGMRTVWALDGLVQLVAAQGQAERAVRLAGAAAAWRERLAGPASVTERAQLEHWLRPARAALGERLSSKAWALGRALSLEQAVVSALEAAVAGERQRGGPRRPRDTLTAREREVAALVAGGLSTRAIAEALVITEATARVHVERILNKLDLHSRVQLAAWALQHGLAPPAN